jgi:hypothetical protein
MTKCKCGGKVVIPAKKVPPKKVAPKKPKKITNVKRSNRLKKINTRRATKAANAGAKGCKCS